MFASACCETPSTLTAKWLAQTIPNVTVILLSAEQLGLVKECCRLARALAPSLVIMEDVDLMADEMVKAKADGLACIVDGGHADMGRKIELIAEDSVNPATVSCNFSPTMDFSRYVYTVQVSLSRSATNSIPKVRGLRIH